MPTLADLAKSRDPDGAQAALIEQLERTNAFLPDAVWKEGNLPTGHRVAARTGLPSVGWRAYNEGVAASKSRRDTFDETCGMLEGHTLVDCELAGLYSDPAAFRYSEEQGMLQAMNAEMEYGMIYHSTKTAPEKFHGLAPRLNATTDPYGGQIVDSQIAATDSDQTSVWLVVWGPNTVFGIFPKGSVAGLTPHDMGEQMVADSSGNRFRAYETVWNWKIGLVVADARYFARLANIDTSAIAKSGKLLIEDMISLYYAVKDVRAGRAAFYCNRLVHEYLHNQAVDTVKNSSLSIDNIGGQPIVRFLGIPVRMTDAILNTEAIIT
jgi:hypothetical protein